MLGRDCFVVQRGGTKIEDSLQYKLHVQQCQAGGPYMGWYHARQFVRN